MKLTIQDVIQHLTTDITLPENTVDQLLIGSAGQDVQGIFVTFMPTHHVIEHAVRLNANLIIAHEPPFYNHHSQTDWLMNDPVYEAKRTLIEEARVAIYRCHDAIHRYQPDGITEGLIQALGWSSYVEKHRPEADILSFPAGTTVQDIANHMKKTLGLEYVRVAGSPTMDCKRAAVLVGFRGNGPLTIPLFQNEELDLIIAGEGFEWETPEYVRDAVQQGKEKALIMMGHAESEASGMKLLADRLSAVFPTVPIHFVADQSIFKVL
ncbi:Nif3-like dinuclear metal center hexameric protein [Paenibacillus tundrae]|uniref:Nif3-like dinuclear metal center hexameric protein n=1 Tax=Paenibacillus tundrae TaxID=528187 RepID=UPI0030CF4F05